jgi:cytochrome c5
VVDAHQLGQLALAEGPAVGQQVQDAELSGLESATATAAPAAAKRKSSRRPSPRPTVVSKSTTSARAASGTRQDDLDKLVTLCEVCHRRVRKKKMR